MAIRKVVQIGHPALKAKNQSITNFKDIKLKKLIQDLKDTLRKNGLIGIAAQQIAENYKVFVTEIRDTPSRKVTTSDKFRVYINPHISFFSTKENVIYEGCGSVINGRLFAPVKRPQEITIEAFDATGKKFQVRCDGILARVIQHEYDHLHGIEFLEKILDYKKVISDYYYRKYIRTSKEQTEPSKIHVLEYKLLI